MSFYITLRDPNTQPKSCWAPSQLVAFSYTGLPGVCSLGRFLSKNRYTDTHTCTCKVLLFQSCFSNHRQLPASDPHWEIDACVTEDTGQSVFLERRERNEMKPPNRKKKWHLQRQNKKVAAWTAGTEEEIMSLA